MKRPKVSIIVVNYNGKKFLKDCFASLTNLNYPKSRLEIIMVDNGSADNSIEYVKENFPKVKILKNDVNNYCRANNLGIKHARGEYIAFLNNDTKVNSQWLNKLIQVIESNPLIGAVTGKMLFPDGKIQGTGHYDFPNFYWGDRGFKDKDNGQYAIGGEIDSISNTAALYRKSIFRKIGLFDEDFNMFMEDVDISIRCRKHNLKLFYVPSAVVCHMFHGTAEEKFLQIQIKKNRLFLIGKHYPEKLAEALCDGFLKEGFKTEHDEIYKILPEVLRKFLRYHNFNTVTKVLPELFDSLKKILNYEKYYLIQEIDGLEDKLKLLSDKELEWQSTRKQLDSTRQELDSAKQELNDINQNLENAAREANIQIEKLSQKIAEEEKRGKEREALLIELRQILKERDLLMQNLSKELGAKEEVLKDKLSLLEKTVEELTTANLKMQELQESIRLKEETLMVKERIIDKKSEELTNRDLQILELQINVRAKEEEIFKIQGELSKVYDWVQKFYRSQTYRFFVRQLWWFFDMAKKLNIFKKTRKVETLVIKPSVVSLEATEKFIEDFREGRGNVFIALVANLTEKEEYYRIIQNKFITKKFIFCPQIKPLGIWVKIRLILSLRRSYYREAIILIGPCIRGGYRKAKLLAWLSGAKETKLHFLIPRQESVQRNAILKPLFFTIIAQLALYLFLLFFVVFIVGGVKFKQLIYKIKKHN